MIHEIFHLITDGMILLALAFNIVAFFAVKMCKSSNVNFVQNMIMGAQWAFTIMACITFIVTLATRG